MGYFTDLVVFIHVICGVILGMTLVIMQVVVNPALTNISQGAEKKAFSSVVQNRWHPVVDAAIIILTISGLFLLYARWPLIVANHLLHLKVMCAVITLTCANLLHFYYRGKKRGMVEAGDTGGLEKANRKTRVMEKVALVFGASTLILGIVFNHFPF